MSVFSMLRDLGSTYDIRGLEHAIKQLLRRGYADGFLSIKVKSSNKYLELTKYIHSCGKYGLLLYVPVETWSEGYIHMIQNYLDNEEIEFSYDSPYPGKPASFICIDCKNNASRAHKIVNEIFIHIFLIPKSIKYSIVLSNCSPWDELIENPHQKPLSWARGIKQLNAEITKKIGSPLWDMVVSIILGCAQMVGTVGLVYILMFSEARYLVHFDVVGAAIKVPILGLIFCGLMLFGALRVLTRFFWVKFLRTEKLYCKDKWEATRLFHAIRYAILNKLNFISIVLFIVAFSSWIARP